MKALKKLAALATLLAIVGTVTACGGDTEEQPDSPGDYMHAYSQGLDENGHFVNIKASDIITLPEYKGVDITPDAIEASEEAVKEQIDIILENYNTYEEITDRAIVDGDTVNIDYVGYMDEKPISGTNTGKLGTDVTIGKTDYIEGFLEQLIGHTPGESFSINVVFPEDHADEELAGKPAEFKVTVNHIHGDVIPAVLNDEIAKNMGHENVDALLADLKEWLVSSARFEIFSKLLDEATCENVPEEVINYLITYDKAQFEYYAYSYAVTVDEYVKNYFGSETFDEFVESNMENYKSDAIRYLAAQAIAEIEGIEVTTEDITAAGYTNHAAEYGEPYIKQFMLFQTVIPDFIVENGVAVEATDTSAAVE